LKSDDMPDKCRIIAGRVPDMPGYRFAARERVTKAIIVPGLIPEDEVVVAVSCRLEE
jgi:hypothetical protein